MTDIIVPTVIFSSSMQYIRTTSMKKIGYGRVSVAFIYVPYTSYTVASFILM